MTTNDQDLRALTYLARRLRDETHGCRQWDEAGTFACLKDALAGQNLLIACQRVLGHATDPTAQTPGAIKRNFTPEPTNAPVRVPYDAAKWCHVCGHPEHECRGGEHAFLSVARAKGIASSPVPQELRDAIAPTRTWPDRPTLTELAAPAVKADEARATRHPTPDPEPAPSGEEHAHG